MLLVWVHWLNELCGYKHCIAIDDESVLWRVKTCLKGFNRPKKCIVKTCRWILLCFMTVLLSLMMSPVISKFRVRKYTKCGVFYAKIVQMTPLRLRMESLRLQKFSVTNREPLRLQKCLVTNTVLSLPFSQQIQFTLIVNVVNLN